LDSLSAVAAILRNLKSRTINDLRDFIFNGVTELVKDFVFIMPFTKQVLFAIPKTNH
jgi:hypothetical protein